MEEEKLEIYPERRKKSFDLELKLLKKAEISQRNKELITEFHNYVFSTGSNNIRVAKLSSQLRTICRWLKHIPEVKTNLDDLARKDALNLVAFINKLPSKSESTKLDYRRAIKQFYRWYKDEDKRVTSKSEEIREETKKFYHYIEKEVSRSIKLHQADPNTIITDEDIALVIETGTTNPKDKAFLSLLHETGCRAAEFLNLRVGDFILRDGYLEIHVPDGKTGKRTIYASKSIPHVLRYLEMHPFKANKNSLFWLSSAQQNKNEPLMYIGGKRLIERCFKRSGLKKRHNWHWFRHSRATILAPKLTEVMLCKYMGWTIGSNQVKTYVHLCNEQVKDAFLAMNGIKAQEEVKEHPIKCICGTLNGARERYCYKCYKPLSVEVAIQDNAEEVKELKLMNEEIAKTMKFFMEMAKNPEMMARFEEFRKLM